MSSPGLSQIMLWNASIVDADISSLVMGWRNPFAKQATSCLKVQGFAFGVFRLQKDSFPYVHLQSKNIIRQQWCIEPRKAQTRYQPLSSVLISFQFIFGLGDALSLVATG